jgi:molybdopterin molybdotransferase
MSESAIELEQARAKVLAAARALPPEEVALGEALGRHLAAEVQATAPLQGFDNSAMDGFALRAADTAGATVDAPAAVTLAGESRAGKPAASASEAGTAIAISTGAMLPAGADAVVRVESTRRDGDRILVEEPVAAGRDVRRAGEDVAAGETVLEPGARLGPAELGILAAVGRDTVLCNRRPRVSLVTSGDELVPPGSPLPSAGVHDSNSFSLPALARLAGAEVASVAWTPDDPERTARALEDALAAEVAVVCGGVSVGAHDHVKAALGRLGVEEEFWRVALRPGGPTWFGRRGETLVFGLPGNPVSAMVAFILFVRPALIALGGGAPRRRRTVATLAKGVAKRSGRAQALRCRLELTPEGWLAHPAPQQGSHVLSSMLGADCLAIVPGPQGDVEAGARVEIELLDGASMAP